MANNRFNLLSPEAIRALADSADNENTKRSTGNWMKIFSQWATVRCISESIEVMDAQRLDKVLSQFYAEVKKQNGQDYEPDSLRVMQSSIHRYLIEKHCTFNILKDKEFITSRKTLEGKAKMLREQGMGKKRNSSKALDKGEEDILWNYQKLGDFSAISLVRTMWFVCTQHFGLRGVQEHTTMMVNNFSVLHDEAGSKYIEFFEDPTKTRQGGLRPNLRPTNPKMFAVGGDRCPVRLFELYMSKRPVELKNCGRFYLTPKQNVLRTDEIWYSRNPMGKNTISSIMKCLISGTPLESCGKKLTNHSMRKTTVKKLKAANVAESSIIKVTGHTSTKGLNSYDPGDENEFRHISNALSNCPQPSSSSSSKIAETSHKQINSLYNIENDIVNNENNRATYVFHGCTVNFNTTNVTKTNSRKRNYVIYDTESSQSQEE